MSAFPACHSESDFSPSRGVRVEEPSHEEEITTNHVTDSSGKGYKESIPLAEAVLGALPTKRTVMQTKRLAGGRCQGTSTRNLRNQLSWPHRGPQKLN